MFLATIDVDYVFVEGTGVPFQKTRAEGPGLLRHPSNAYIFLPSNRIDTIYVPFDSKIIQQFAIKLSLLAK